MDAFKESEKTLDDLAGFYVSDYESYFYDSEPEEEPLEKKFADKFNELRSQLGITQVAVLQTRFLLIVIGVFVIITSIF